MVTRIISAIVAIIFAVGVLCVSNTLIFNITVSALTIIGLYELFKAVGCLEYRKTILCGYIYAFLAPIVSKNTGDIKNCALLAVICIFFMFITYIINHKTLRYEKLFSIMAITLMVVPAMTCIVLLRNIDTRFGIAYIILALCGAWFADTGAYFVGTFFGKHKLCPEISPKKTIEGFIGGILTNGVMFIAYTFVFSLIMKAKDVIFTTNYFLVFTLGCICAILGTIGDLSASMIKRQCGIKDYGNIMPGHGGVMDRFDSVLFVVPFMYICLSVFKLYR